MNPHLFELVKKKALEYAIKGPFNINKIDERTKIEFFMLLASHEIIPKKTPFHGDTVLKEHVDLFLDWYLFEKTVKNGKTAAEIYVKSKRFKRDFRGMNTKKMEVAVKKLKNPVWDYFTVCKKGKKELNVRMLEGKKTITVHDRKLPSHVAVGDVLHMKLYCFKGTYHVSGTPLLVDPESITKYYQIETLINELEEVFSRFLETVPYKRREYEGICDLLMGYVADKGYTTMEAVKKIDVNECIRWLQQGFIIAEEEIALFQITSSAFLMYVKGQK